MAIDWKISDKYQKLEPPEEENPEWFEEYIAVVSTIGRKTPVYDKDDAIGQLKVKLEYLEDAIAIIEDCD